MATGPSRSAGRPGPADTGQRRAVPARPPSFSITSDRPSAGLRPCRRRSQVLAKRSVPKHASSSASRRARSLRSSSRIAITAAPPRVEMSGLFSLSRLRERGGVTASALALAARGAYPSDHVALQRREAVEGDGGVGRGVGARASDQDLVADLERDRQPIGLLLVEHVGGVAGRPGEHAGGLAVLVVIGLDRVP